MEIKPENDIHCCKCGNDTFKLNESSESNIDSLSIVCTKCGDIKTLGAGLTVRDVIYCMKINLS